MLRAHRSWYRKFVELNLWATLYSSWLLGLFPFVYISRTRRIKRSGWLVGYGIAFNVLLLWLATHYYEATQSQAKQELFTRNPLAEEINVLHNGLLLLTVFVMYFRNWWMSNELGQILNVLLEMHDHHFRRYDTSDCYNFDNYIVYKGACTMLELISIIWIIFGLSPRYNIGLLVGVLSIMVIQLGVYMVTTHFHICVMFVYRSIWIINRELLQLVNCLERRQVRKSSRIHKLFDLYRRLLELNRRIVGVYDYQITLFIVSLLTVNVISIFYILVYVVSLRKAVTFYMFLNFLQALSINISDFWLNIAVCDLAVSANRSTAAILKLFNDIPQLDKQLERNLNDFALFSSHRRLTFNHFGMFDVHNAMGFRMVIACTLYMLYLVQFDYVNLMRTST
ncbi:gustatory receptor for bitter taste 22e [Drosophila sulfurigaster albostrigata]|uniref:gustatory receptor for bitter taste 22e n=1 Tax=Drosophila sulfurigaster albostrigata TaxID=89887 RepID=UPI002D21B090|nr:gustatory receptor for bitter taste 22e [Drosophila sulfurigaster albostrigata]